MSKNEKDYPAYPISESESGGMSARDYFAAQALGSIITRDGFTGRLAPKKEEQVREAYRFADEMLKQRL